jgi:hypothetical protein
MRLGALLTLLLAIAGTGAAELTLLKLSPIAVASDPPNLPSLP